jgi:hypothetical protein
MQSSPSNSQEEVEYTKLVTNLKASELPKVNKGRGRK